MTQNKHNSKGLVLLSLLLFFMYFQVHATTYTLNLSLGVQINWNDTSAWQPNGVPGAGDDVIINGTESSSVITNGDVTVKSMTISKLNYIFGPGTLTVTELLDTRYPMFWQMNLTIATGANATMTNVNFPNNYEGIIFYSDVVVDGNLVLEARAFSANNITINGTLTQKEGNLKGRIAVNSTGVLNIDSPNYDVELGTLDNNGTFNWQSGKIQAVGGWLTNTGAWNINATNAAFSYGGFSSYFLITNTGNIQISSNLTSLSLLSKILNKGQINMNGATQLSLYSIEHYGSITGGVGSSLSIVGYYNNNGSNTFYSGSTINIPTFKTEESTNLVIKSGANISAVQNFIFGAAGQGLIDIGVALPPAATYEIGGYITTNVNQNFTGTFILQRGYIDGTSNFSFNTPNFISYFGHFGSNIKVDLSASTVLTLKSLSVCSIINNGTINWGPNGTFSAGCSGMVNNGTFNMNGDSLYFYCYDGLGANTNCINNGTMNINNKMTQANALLKNLGTINIGGTTDLQISGELQHFGTIEGQPGSKLGLYSTNVEHVFNAGAQTSGLSVLETNFWGKTNFKLGTVLNNIASFVVDFGRLETSIILPPSSNYLFKKAEIRLNTVFEPTTILEVEDTKIEGSGNIRIGNGMNWNGGTIDVPIRIYENAQAFIKEKEERPTISAPFTNEGNVTLSGGIIEINTSFFKNGGNWNVDSDEDVIMDGFTSFTNEGVFSICGNQPIKIAFNVPFINKTSGTFKGQGSYTFNAGFTNEGTVAPGCSPGILTIEDNLIAPAVVDIEVVGSDMGQYDQLLINGNMTAGGVLNVIVPQGASLNGSIKVIQTTGTFTGTFAQVNMPPNFTLQYLPDGLLLTSDGSVGANDLAIQNLAFTVIPTLASTRVVVTAHQTVSTDTRLEVYNLSGQLVRSMVWNAFEAQKEINVADLANGLYTLRLATLPNWTGRVVVSH
jgi:Secretion system C-terminal sorting domain